MRWTAANQVTVGRIFIAAAFFVVVGLYDIDTNANPHLLGAGFVLYVIAALSDILDGYLARSRNEVSAFGRVADPIVDKVLVVGAFAMLAGPDYVLQPGLYPIPESWPHWTTGGMASLIQPWMVVVIVAREFIVSAVRGYSETLGIPFPAIGAGKAKMFAQSVAIAGVLFAQGWLPGAAWPWYICIVAVWASVILTVGSGLLYLYKARGVFARGDEQLMQAAAQHEPSDDEA